MKSAKSRRRWTPDDEPKSPKSPAPLSAVPTERALIGAVIKAGAEGKDVLPAIRGAQLVEAFSDPDLKSVFALLVERSGRGELNDLMSVALAVREAGLTLGGEPRVMGSDLYAWASELAELTKEGWTARLMAYARELRSVHARRERLSAAKTLVVRLEAEQRPLGDWYADAVGPLAAQVEPSPSPTFGQQLLGAMGEIDHLAETGVSCVPGLPTGITDLDSQLGGLRPGNLVIVAGRTSMGKSAFGVTAALNMARKGVPVAYLSLEMSNRELLHRLISQASGVEVSNLWRGPIDRFAHARVKRAAGELGQLPLTVVEADRDWAIVAQECRRQVTQGCRLLVIDYLGLMTLPNRDLARWEIVGTITGEAKLLARSLDVPIMLLCQLNREVSREVDKSPKLWHLRDSGNVEQDADVVLLIHREGAYDDNARKDVAEINVAKARNGPTGKVTVRWDAKLARFDDFVAGPGPRSWEVV